MSGAGCLLRRSAPNLVMNDKIKIIWALVICLGLMTFTSLVSAWKAGQWRAEAEQWHRLYQQALEQPHSKS